MIKYANWLGRGVALMFFTSSTLSGFTLGDRECGEVEGWARALYWKPTYGGAVWATNSTLAPLTGPFSTRALRSGEFQSEVVVPRHSWGVEGGITYLADGSCLFAESSALYLHEQNSSRISGSLTPTLPFKKGIIGVNNNLFINGSGAGDLSLTFGRADLQGGFVLPVACNFDLRTFAGVRYVYLQEELVARIAGSYNTGGVLRSVDLHQRRQLLFSGTGPTMGLSGHLCLRGGLRVDASCRAMALIGTQKNTSRAIFTAPSAGIVEPGSQSFAVDRCVAITPAIDVDLTVSYTRSWCRMTVRAEVGYSLTHYRAVFNQRLGSTSFFPSLIAQPNRRDVGFAGPHIGGSVAF